MQIRAQRPGPVESGGRSAVRWRGITVEAGLALSQCRRQRIASPPSPTAAARPGSDPLVAKQPASYGSPGNLQGYSRDLPSSGRGWHATSAPLVSSLHRQPPTPDRPCNPRATQAVTPAG